MYDLINVKSKRKKQKNNRRIILFIIFIFFILFLIQNGKKNNEKYQKELDFLQVASYDFSFQIEAEKNIKQKEEINQISNLEGFSEEQMQIILNIYNNTDEKLAFLTFDDGPSRAVTPHILDILKNENIKATFFTLGSQVQSNPDIVKRAYDEGHYIANHGYTHIYSNVYASMDSIFAEYNNTEKCIQDALENPNFHSKLFRFPGGSFGGKYGKLKEDAKEELKKNKIAYLDWNALSNDSAGAKNKEELMESIKNTVGNKQTVVILMHDAGDKISTYETLPDIINFLREKGYKFKTIYDILK